MKTETHFACYAPQIINPLLALACLFPSILSAQVPASEPYVWRNVAMGGGGFVAGIVIHPVEKNLMYARTDVGGAYRWDSAALRWVPITDGLSPADNNLMGIESIALDPGAPNRVYLACGTYSRGNAAILRSDDQGRTFKRADVTFKMGGNETGRGNGERLVVDPNFGDILFFGSRSAGLWKSADRAETWQKVDSFTNTGSIQAASTSTNARARFGGGGNRQAVGIVAIIFDAASGKSGQPTPVLYAAVSTAETSLYASADGGQTWQAIMGQPIGLRPNHLILSPDGWLYLSYGREPGPNSMTDGAVWKFNPRDGAWTDITPVKPSTSGQPFGYGAVAVDARHPSTIMVTTFNHWKPHDEVFRSTNGGATWLPPLLQNAKMDYSSAPYTSKRTPHWLGDLEINPFDSNQVLFTTGYGIWSCINATEADAGNPTRWVFLDDGLEETVPLALISPPVGAHLLSGVGDIDGFRHDDLNVSPAEGNFTGPRFSNTEDMTYAGMNPQVIARTGSGRGAVHTAISSDGGNSWKLLPSDPSSGGGGSIALSADGKIIVSGARRGAASFSSDGGSNWTACAGLASGVRIVADAVNPAQFYAYDARGGRVLISANGAASFTNTDATLPTAGNNSFGGGGMLAATPGIEGDLWLVLRAEGLWHSTNAGTTFTKLASVGRADSLGLGKAAPGKMLSALFLEGTIGQLQALFRSNDAGMTWVRINDDEHQYGYISHVTGDPRIYGRVYFATGGRGVIYGDISRKL